jgi:cytochrome c oxidase subunit I+III
MITSIGAFMFAIGVFVFIVDFLYSVKRGPVAGNNPWDAPTLEWSTSSPPPPYNFAVAPRIASRHPLWEERIAGKMHSQLERGFVLNQGREALGTTVLDGDPDVILKMPEDSYAPFWLGVASLLFFTGLAMTSWWFAGVSLIGCGVAIAAWLWPQRELGQRDDSPQGAAS